MKNSKKKKKCKKAENEESGENISRKKLQDKNSRVSSG